MYGLALRIRVEYSFKSYRSEAKFLAPCSPLLAIHFCQYTLIWTTSSPVIPGELTLQLSQQNQVENKITFITVNSGLFVVNWLLQALINECK